MPDLVRDPWRAWTVEQWEHYRSQVADLAARDRRWGERVGDACVALADLHLGGRR